MSNCKSCCTYTKDRLLNHMFAALHDSNVCPLPDMLPAMNSTKDILHLVRGGKFDLQKTANEEQLNKSEDWPKFGQVFKCKPEGLLSPFWPCKKHRPVIFRANPAKRRKHRYTRTCNKYKTTAPTCYSRVYIVLQNPHNLLLIAVAKQFHRL